MSVENQQPDESNFGTRLDDEAVNFLIEQWEADTSYIY